MLEKNIEQASSLSDIGDEHKTVEYITRDSIERVHAALRGVTGEVPNSFEHRLRILHSIATKATKPRLKLEDISRLSHIPSPDIPIHLQALKEGGLLDNKGGQYWRLTPRGRRLIDNLTILLFEHSGDFDDMDLIRASLIHLDDLAKEYGLDLKVESRILRFFDDILAELEDQSIELLDPIAAKEVRQTLRKAESFYNHIRALLYNNPDILPDDSWTLLDKLAKRHNIVGRLMVKLNQHIIKLGANIDIQEALSYYLENLTPKQADQTFSNFSRFTILNLHPEIPIDLLLNQTRDILSEEPPPKMPEFDMIPVQKIGMGEIEEEYEEELETLFTEIKMKAEQGTLLVSEIINPDDWETSASKLILIARLCSEGWIKLVDEREEEIGGRGVKRIINAEVVVNA